jgi:hypothetical protein
MRRQRHRPPEHGARREHQRLRLCKRAACAADAILRLVERKIPE